MKSASKKQEELRLTDEDFSIDLPSASIEEYLEAVFRILQNDKQYAKTGELAEVLNVAPASVTQMLQKLAKRNYVKYEKGKGARLTRKGRKIALDVLRRHRIAERLLVDLLGVDWEDAHEIACEWEHFLTPDLCNRIVERIDEPLTCPHGNPIPDKEGELDSSPSHSIADLSLGEEAIIDRIDGEDPTQLRRLAAMELLPGRKVRILKILPGAETLQIGVGDTSVTLGFALARQIRIKKV